MKKNQSRDEKEKVQYDIANLFDSIGMNIIDENGGIISNILTASNTVFSESHGLMMEYALLIQDQNLFERYYWVIKGYQHESGLFPWLIIDGVASNSSATLDDLRIFSSLYQANQLWGGYDEEIMRLENGLYEYCVYDGYLSDFYDFNMGQTSSELSLTYIDIVSLQYLCDYNERWVPIKEKSVKILEQGFIGTAMPLYYKQYIGSEYTQEELHTAEALYTLYNLAQVDMLEAESLEWLKEKVEQEALYASYTITGEVPIENQFETTASYALATLIFVMEDEKEFAGKALELMKGFQIKNGPYTYLYGDEINGDIYSFDQLMALLAMKQYEIYLFEQ
ncbi:MAG: hypothetical protein R3Y58_03180 [Eubacteriales bacterium]